MTANTISIEAYHQHIDSGRALTQWQKVFNVLCSNPPLTRAEIETESGIRLSSVCGRVSELMKSGLICERGVRKCRITGVRATVIGPADRHDPSYTFGLRKDAA